MNIHSIFSFTHYPFVGFSNLINLGFDHQVRINTNFFEHIEFDSRMNIHLFFNYFFHFNSVTAYG